MENAEYLARISGAMLAAIVEAKTMAGSGQFGPELADLVQHIRELHEIALEELAQAGEAAGEYARGLAGSLGEAIMRLEALLRPGDFDH
jgi:hypothetical protein